MDEFHERLAHAIEVCAEKLCGSAPFYVERGDLKQEGWLKALEALERYDASHGASRLTWASGRAFDRMRHYLRSEARRRGITTAEWESGESVSREVPLEWADRIGSDGVADRVTTAVLVRDFVEGLEGGDREVCDALLAGAVSMTDVALAMHRSVQNICHIRKRLKRKLRYHLAEYEEAAL